MSWLGRRKLCIPDAGIGKCMRVTHQRDMDVEQIRRERGILQIFSSCRGAACVMKDPIVEVSTQFKSNPMGYSELAGNRRGLLFFFILQGIVYSSIFEIFFI